MNQDVQITELRATHATIKKQIDDEMRHPSPNTARIQKLKREKLRIKDEIAKLD